MDRTEPPEPSRHEGPSWVHGWADDLRDAIAPRAVLLVVGVLVLQIGFILSYVGALHDPTPHEIRLDVVAPAGVSASTVSQLNGLPGRPLNARAASSEAQARSDLEHGTSPAVLVVDPSGTTDTLLVASAGGASTATSVEQVLTKVDARQNRTVAVEDVVPPQKGDARSLTSFYAVIGWLVGGYLAAAALGGARGARASTRRRAIVRLGSMVPYALVSGVAGALVVDQVLGAITGHFTVLWVMGALLVFCAAAVTMGLQVLLGTVGVGATVVLFVILGNPSAGGAYQSPLLPGFWRAIGPWLPNGAAVTVIKNHVYFGGHGTTGPLLVVLAWTVAGAVVMLGGSTFLHRRDRHPPEHSQGRSNQS